MYLDEKSPAIDFSSREFLTLSDEWKVKPEEIRMYLRLKRELYNRDLHWMTQKHNAKIDISIYQGQPFSPQMLKRYRDEAMLPIASRRIKRDLNTIADNVFRGRQVGVVRQTVKEDASIPANDVQDIVNKLKSDMNFDNKAYNNILKTAMISGFFTYAEIDIKGRLNGHGIPIMKTYEWDTILPPPVYDNNFWEINDVITKSFMSFNDLRATFPKRRKAIDDYIQKKFDEDNIDNLERSIRAYTQDQLNLDIEQSTRGYRFSWGAGLGRGVVDVFDWKRPLYAQTTVYVTDGVEDEKVLPLNWSEDRIVEWEKNNPYYHKEFRSQKVMWRTIWADDGLMLYNGLHWYQNDCKLNGCMFACEMIMRKPEGFIAIARDIVRVMSASQTEGLYQLMIGSGQRVVVRDGALKYPDRLDDELKSRISKFEMNEDSNIQQDLIINNKNPDRNYLDFISLKDQELDKTLGITEDIQGRSMASSSNFRTQTSILQTMTSYGEYMRNLTQWNRVMTDVLLNSLPTIFTNQRIEFTTLSSDGQDSHNIELNQSEIQEEQVGNRRYHTLKIIANDPTKGKYSYIIDEDSPSALSLADNEEGAMNFLGGVGNTILDPNAPIEARRTIAEFMAEQHFNQMLRDLGLAMLKSLEKEEQAMEEQAQGQPQAMDDPADPNAQLDPDAMQAMQEPMQAIPQQNLMDNTGMDTQVMEAF